MKPRTTFYFPKKKVTVETNTTHFEENKYKDKPQLDQIEDLVKDSLFEQSYTPKTQYEQSLMDGMRSQVTFFTMSFNDEESENFDKLTLPKDIYSKVKPILRFELDSDHITICNPNNRKTISFFYHENLKPVLDCLETKFVNSEFYAMMQIIECDVPIEGQCLCECIDFRISPPYESNILLTFSSETMKEAAREKMSASPDDGADANYQQLLFEQKLLLLSQPEICVDPSIEVARTMSCIDWREKMWPKTHPDDSKNDFVPVEKSATKAPKKFFAPSVSNAQIHLSDKMQSAFAGLCQRPM